MASSSSKAREKSQKFKPQEETLSQEEEKTNAFANDGSFLELFRKKMEQQQAQTFSQKRVLNVDDKTSSKVEESQERVHSSSTSACTDSQSSDSRTSDSDKQKKPIHKPYQVISNVNFTFIHSVYEKLQSWLTLLLLVLCLATCLN